ncbi:hypothetical protein N9L68_02155 [bacterium]|nr:hypothetical protein [bacterium]
MALALAASVSREPDPPRTCDNIPPPRSITYLCLVDRNHAQLANALALILLIEDFLADSISQELVYQL